MADTGIFYASATGKTGRLVDQMVELWGDAVHRSMLIDSCPKDLLRFDCLLLGSPTYGVGDLHHHWPEFLEKMAGLDLSGKTVGLFVMADGRYHGESFAGALGLLYDAIQPLGATILGTSNPDDYSFGATTSVRADGQFPGLVIDGSTPGERRKTPQRIANWIAQVRASSV